MRKLICLALFLFGTSAFTPRSEAQVVHSNTMTWTAPTGVTVTGYNVYRAAGSCTATFTKLTSTPITALTFTDSGLADGAINCYYVSSVNASGETPQSMCPMLLLTTPTSVAALTPPPPARPAVTVN